MTHKPIEFELCFRKGNSPSQQYSMGILIFHKYCVDHEIMLRKCYQAS